MSGRPPAAAFGRRPATAFAIRPFPSDVPEEDLTTCEAASTGETRWARPGNRCLLRACSWDDQALASYGGPEIRLAQRSRRGQGPAAFMTRIDGVDVHFIHVRSTTRTRCHSSSTQGGPRSTMSS